MDIDYGNNLNNNPIVDTVGVDLNNGESRIILNGSVGGGSNLTNILNRHYSVNVSIEPNHEFEIQEIKYDGEEIYKE